jgi:hypothetical protein
LREKVTGGPEAAIKRETDFRGLVIGGERTLSR